MGRYPPGRTRVDALTKQLHLQVHNNVFLISHNRMHNLIYGMIYGKLQAVTHFMQFRNRAALRCAGA